LRGIFFGSSTRVAEIVNRSIRLDLIVIENNNFSKEIFDFSHYIGAELKVADNVDEIRDISSSTEIGVSYGFGLIFTQTVINCFKSGILNIHTGDLPEYRSRHPISWAMIKGESRIGVTIHLVDEKIDCGFLVHKFYVDRSCYDDLISLEEKIENALNSQFPIALEQLKKGELEKLGKGNYYPRIDQTFNQVDPNEMTSKEVFSLFMSQKIYGGVNLICGKRIECHIYCPEYRSHYEGYDIYCCTDGIKIAVK
jgi:folate-dependent phosphoribosylglycinamide formyltransferase PurN